jgi:amino acid transporter
MMSTASEPAPHPKAGAPTAKIVIATTVALTFISFWRGAAIVLSDLASTMFYVGGIAEKAIGPSAPWFVVAVMLFSFAVRSIYLESCSMFVRGGIYVVVRNSMGPFMAKLSVSALVVDYLLTGPISSVSAGQYLGRLVNELFELGGLDMAINPATFAMVFGLLVTVYFWRENIKGIHESSGKALRIMQITTVMVVALLIWCPITLLLRDTVAWPPPPAPAHLKFTDDSLGWLRGTFWPTLGAAGLIIAFGHSLLAMSGFETLAQVYREIGAPKLKNLKITANIVCLYALVSTGLLSVFAVMIIPDATRPQYYDNLLGGLSMSLAGPFALRLVFHVFVVIVGVLILSGAVNTSIIGANGVLNRVAEDGVLLDWFRRPHKKFGTTHHVINVITVAQMLTILGSRGDVYLLGEAYAFGVVWSFFLKGLGVLALRFQRHDQEYKVPLNLRVGGVELPIGLAVTTMMLFLVALANLFTKQIATIYGVSATVALCGLFLISERINRKRAKQGEVAMEEFNLDYQPQVDAQAMAARPGCVLVSLRDNSRMHHLDVVLEKTNLRRHDIVVMTVRNVRSAGGEYELADRQLFTQYEQDLFSHVVNKAEKAGKHVDLLVVPAVDPFLGMVQTAAQMKASRLVTGVSAKMTSEDLAVQIGRAWEKLPEPRHPFSLEVISPDRPSIYVNLGPHPPRLWPEDLDRLHDVWLKMTGHERFGSKLHHRDVVGVALRRLETDLNGPDRDEVLRDMEKELRNH